MTKALNVVELECSACGKKYDASVEQHLCTCGKPLLARYDLKRAAATLTLESLKSRARTLWRYAEVLPNDPAVSLGEGMTPLVHAERLGASITTTEAGASAKQPISSGGESKRSDKGGLRRLFIKDEGLNPTGSFKARGMTAAVSRARQFGAKVVKLNGLISDCGKYVAECKDREGWYDVSTLKEPYRIEGKKTMGYELWEQFGGKLPEVI